ncbi:MAG: GNAT family N-acetyltransferase [Prevotellaceae bacterium]|jgi:ribosomal protein S18 acetylase RimI-like enzyme|nr:GNAT family N-acetyltransferase [Prevotellaceae bacterium]
MAMIQVIKCNYKMPEHVDALVTLVNSYIDDKMGGGKPLSGREQANMVRGLKNHPKSIVLLALYKSTYAGLLVAFEDFSTFTAHPMLYIHDVFVMKDFRGKGIGKRLMNVIIAEAEIRNCSRVTLEVRKDNFVAQNLYIDLGFDEAMPEMFYWRKILYCPPIK